MNERTPVMKFRQKEEFYGSYLHMVFGLILLNLRFLVKREIKQLSVFKFCLIIGLSSADGTHCTERRAKTWNYTDSL